METTQTTSETQAFEEWAILELMGHRRLAGLVTEVEKFNTKLLRIDIPTGDGSFHTQFYGGSSLYCLTPTTEEIARAVAVNSQPTPVHRWELPAPKKTEETLRAEDLEEFEDD